jgi:uncharacterized protein DUF6983
VSGTAPTSVVSTVPLIAAPQKLSVSLNGNTYNLTCKWNQIAQLWVLDIADGTDTVIVGGIPLVTGTDLLSQYESLGIGGSLIVQTTNDPDVPPTFTNLGTQSFLYYIAPVQAAAL